MIVFFCFFLTDITPELKLAQSLYMNYTEQLIQDINDDEEAFKKAYKELTDLQHKLGELQNKTETES